MLCYVWGQMSSFGVRPSITSRSYIETDERIEIIFGVVATIGLFYTLEGNLNVWKIRAFPSGTYPKTALKFCHNNNHNKSTVAML